MRYHDIHTHLTHERFHDDRDEVICRAQDVGLDYIITNGLDPESNKMGVSLAQKHRIVFAAAGIYPVHAVHPYLPSDFALKIKPFSLEEAIQEIENMAQAQHIVAIGECGLDGYWVGEECFAYQEKIFEQLIDIACRYDLAIIVHSRKREQRCYEILRSLGAPRINFHCFGGKTKWALRWAEEHPGVWFSMPANIAKNEAFRKLAGHLPLEKILTETDAPYLAPIRGERNEPCHVVGTVKTIADIRGLKEQELSEVLQRNLESCLGPHVMARMKS